MCTILWSIENKLRHSLGKLCGQRLHDGVTLGVVIGLGLHHFMQTAQMGGMTAGDAFEQQPRDFSLTVKLGLRRP